MLRPIYFIISISRSILATSSAIILALVSLFYPLSYRWNLLSISANLTSTQSEASINANAILESESSPNISKVSGSSSPPLNSEELTPPTTDPELSVQDLYIQAINPGYTVDSKRDVGEFIELRRTSDLETPLLLTGYSLRYTNASGTSTVIYTFPDGSLMTGETLLLRLSRTAEEGTYDDVYMTTLALSAGPLELLYQNQVIDQVCWTGKNDCAAAFKSATPTTLVRTGPIASSTATFSHQTDYLPSFNPQSPALQFPPETPADGSTDNSLGSSSGSCVGLMFSEIYTYYASSNQEQFIELYNPTDNAISLAGCALSYKNKTYALPSESISSQSYYAFYPAKSTSPFSFTKNPTSSNTVSLIDTNNSVVDILTFSHGQKKTTSFALVYDAHGEELWVQTYALTPAAENYYQEFRSCETGKVINPATGNCVKIANTDTTSTDCPAGKYRNPLTGRCKTIETETSLKPCAEGYERNPETNRCRKIAAENDGAGYSLSPVETSNERVFIAFGVIALIVTVVIIYIILQFRFEIVRMLRKIRQRLYDIIKHLLP